LLGYSGYELAGLVEEGSKKMLDKSLQLEANQPKLAGVKCSHCGLMDSLRKMASKIMQIVYSCTSCQGKTTIKPGVNPEGQKQMNGSRADHGPNRAASDEEHQCCVSNSEQAAGLSPSEFESH
jgi:hypothetical protein